MKWTKHNINFLLLINFNFIFCIIIIVFTYCVACIGKVKRIISVHGSIYI